MQKECLSCKILKGLSVFFDRLENLLNIKLNFMATMETNNSNNKSNTIQTHWHAEPVDTVFEKLATSNNGLSTREAKKRFDQYGPNRLPPQPRRSSLKRFLLQFHNVLIYVLLGAALITALLADWIDAGVIIGVVVINAIIGFIQEGKAEKAVDAIRNILTLETIVIRDQHKKKVKADELVPGDIVFLQSGDKVPADLRLVKTKTLRIEEAALTGESVPVDKSPEPVEREASLGDRYGMAFSGTLVSYGQGSGVVVATGKETELGKVSNLLSSVETLKTRLTEQIAEFSKWLTGAILVLAIGTLLFGLILRNYSFTEIFFASVALAVAAIPEGLPAIITITLALGVKRMASRNAIIRRLPAVETLGSVTVICSDKTGTLTRNEMTVTNIITSENSYEIEGVGYDPHGNFVLDGQEIEPGEDPVLLELIRAGMLCNESSLEHKDEGWLVNGDPTDGALITLAMKAGLDSKQTNLDFPRMDTIPFESEHKFMATLHHDHEGQGFVYLKGAPERVIEMCSHQRNGNRDIPIDTDFWQEQVKSIARQGQRTLAVATMRVDQKREMTFEDVKSELTMLGMFGLIDPPREEAVQAIQSCIDAAIKVKMITGDHALTAASIGSMIGLENTDRAVTGQQIENMDDIQLKFEVQQSDIFARVSPEHKLRLVKALQSDGHITAMTGDGVNDAPALKRANVGVAMGMKGTEAAKEAAEMVLADDNFSSIVNAVEEGRTVYDNIKKTLAFILPTNGAQAGIIIASVMMGIELPITPLQILWINMVTAVTLGLALAFEPPESDVMHRPPRSSEEPLLTQFLSWRIIFVSSIMVMGTLGLFIWDRTHGETLAMARTTAVTTLIFFQIFYLFNSRYLKSSVLSRHGLFENKVVIWASLIIIVLQVLFVNFPLFQTVFGTQAIPASDWIMLLFFTAIVFILVETEKFIFKKMKTKKRSDV